MNKLAHTALNIIKTPFAFAAIFGPIIAVGLLIASLFDSSTPGHYDFYFFAQKYCWWYVAMSSSIAGFIVVNKSFLFYNYI